ncbi:hypothetical protein HCC30_16425 [Streptomyces sp. HNM0574]|nr:hypothetical protein [Streptomyces sp. HNM0574]
MFAGVLMLVNGVLGALVGIAGLAKDDVYGSLGDYVFKFDVTTWGWIHLILGVLVALTGAAILTGSHWARATGVVLAALSAIAHFMWLPYQPVWAVVCIAIAVFVAWALCTDMERNPARPAR